MSWDAEEAASSDGRVRRGQSEVLPLEEAFYASMAHKMDQVLDAGLLREVAQEVATHLGPFTVSDLAGDLWQDHSIPVEYQVQVLRVDLETPQAVRPAVCPGRCCLTITAGVRACVKITLTDHFWRHTWFDGEGTMTADAKLCLVATLENGFVDFDRSASAMQLERAPTLTVEDDGGYFLISKILPVIAMLLKGVLETKITSQLVDKLPSFPLPAIAHSVLPRTRLHATCNIPAPGRIGGVGPVRAVPAEHDGAAGVGVGGAGDADAVEEPEVRESAPPTVEEVGVFTWAGWLESLGVGEGLNMWAV